MHPCVAGEKCCENGGNTLVFVVYDGINNSVFASQVLQPLLKRAKKNQHQKIYLVSFERTLLNEQKIARLVPHRENIIFIQFWRFPFLGKMGLRLSVMQLRSFLRRLPCYSLIARGPLAGWVSMRAVSPASCASYTVQARGLLAQEYELAHPTGRNLVKALFCWIRKKQMAAVEYAAFCPKPELLLAKFRIEAVTPALKEYLVKEYAVNPSHVVLAVDDMPARIVEYQRLVWREEIRNQLHLGPQTHVYCYSGAVKPWQCPDGVVDYFKNELAHNKNSFLLVLTQDVEAFSRVLKEKQLDPKYYALMTIPHDEMSKYLSACDTGIVFREKHIVSWISRPVKAMEYKSAGLKIAHNHTSAWLIDVEKEENTVAVLGTGYVGLVVGSCVAKFGTPVICADIDERKIEFLKNGISPIYEPGVEDLIMSPLLTFTTDLVSAIKKARIIFVAVPTPAQADGNADVSVVKEVAKLIAKHSNDYKIVCLKSTVPIGTHAVVASIIQDYKKGDHTIDIVSTPEFLREGTAVYDYLYPDRVIIGTKSERAYEAVRQLYLRMGCRSEKIIWTDNPAAETIKYVANSFLALKISFINEIANFCDRISVDVLAVAYGVGLDKRIGTQFLKPGPGYGGSCFPKDVQALLSMAQEAGSPLKIMEQAVQINELQRYQVVYKIKNLVGENLRGKVIAILGLAFKANTDDVRKSPAIDIIGLLLKEGALIRAYDPQAMFNLRKELPDITYCLNAYDAAQGAHIAVVLTEWAEFATLDLAKLHPLMKQPCVLDTRNIVPLQRLKASGFRVDTVGRSAIAQDQDMTFIPASADRKKRLSKPAFTAHTVVAEQFK